MPNKCTNFELYAFYAQAIMNTSISRKKTGKFQHENWLLHKGHCLYNAVVMGGG